MNDTSQRIAPKINDQYWFDYSEKLITNGQEVLDNAVVKIQSFVLWLWGIYTASTAIGFALSGKELALCTTLFIASPSVLLIMTYACTVWVQAPVLMKFDPRSPDDIKIVYSKNIEQKSERIKLTIILLVIAAIMVSFAIIVASIAKPNNPKEPEKTVAPA